jgi:hypothetical protein
LKGGTRPAVKVAPRYFESAVSRFRVPLEPLRQRRGALCQGQAYNRRMPQQALLRLVKRWQRYRPRAEWSAVPRDTRGFYVLYANVRPKTGRVKQADVTYIGISGLGERSGIRSRLRRHNQSKPDWKHFSFFEVHDNVTGEEIRELEALLLQIFQHDSRVGLSNVQTGSRKFRQARKRALWKASVAPARSSGRTRR